MSNHFIHHHHCSPLSSHFNLIQLSILLPFTFDHIQIESQPPQTPVIHVPNPPQTPVSPVSNHPKSPQTANKELRVYVKRKRPVTGMELSTPLTLVQEPEPSPKPTQIHSGKGNSNLETESIIDDSEMPIALRKGVRTCT